MDKNINPWLYYRIFNFNLFNCIKFLKINNLALSIIIYKYYIFGFTLLKHVFTLVLTLLNDSFLISHIVFKFGYNSVQCKHEQEGS